MSFGTSNGGEVQPRASRAPLISSAPSGEPCDDDLPALVGAPKPMVVLQAMSVGLSDVCALVSAAAIAFWSWPSTRTAFQPDASKRFTWSVESDSDRAPSIEMPLSSNSTINFDSFRWPASAMASCEMPSIRSPSEAST